MLVTHARFLVQVSEKVTNDLIAEFTEKATSLESFPGRNPWADDPNLPEWNIRSCSWGKWLLMLYQVRSDSIYIDYVVDCRQDYDGLKKLRCCVKWPAKISIQVRLKCELDRIFYIVLSGALAIGFTVAPCLRLIAIQLFYSFNVLEL